MMILVICLGVVLLALVVWKWGYDVGKQRGIEIGKDIGWYTGFHEAIAAEKEQANG